MLSTKERILPAGIPADLKGHIDPLPVIGGLKIDRSKPAKLGGQAVVASARFGSDETRCMVKMARYFTGEDARGQLATPGELSENALRCLLREGFILRDHLPHASQTSPTARLIKFGKDESGEPLIVLKDEGVSVEELFLSDRTEKNTEKLNQTILEIGLKAALALGKIRDTVLLRDIKSANLLFNKENGQVRWCDFGQAVLIDSAEDAKLPHVTFAGVSRQDPAFDIDYSLKREVLSFVDMLFHMATNQHLDFESSISSVNESLLALLPEDDLKDLIRDFLYKDVLITLPELQNRLKQALGTDRY